MEALADDSDVVIVGGGIAGSAMAIVLARRGVRVTVLERQRTYRDRVRGEYLAVWGVAEAQQLDLLETLLEAGGSFVTRSVPYDETVPPDVAPTIARDLRGLIPGVPGALCVGHPAACAALRRAAEAEGATYVLGVGRVEVTAGSHPGAVYQVEGKERRLACRLVVGADGRTSTVRKHAGIPIHEAPPTHTVAGLLVDGVTGWPEDSYTLGTQGDLPFFIFPQGGQRVRLYVSTSMEQRDRFAGPDGAARFLEAFGPLTCLPMAAAFAASQPIGPCAVLGGEDTWTDVPFVDGVALIGDAAGYNDPIAGQGLALALRDVRELSEWLVADSDWSPERLLPYAEERRERMRRLRFTATILAALYCTTGPEGAERRARFYRRLREGDDPSYTMALAAVFIGPEKLPAWAFEDDLYRKVLN